jgi:hypothetical protein
MEEHEEILEGKNFYVLPGKYSYQRQYSDYSMVLTFQTLEEMEDYMRREDERDCDDEYCEEEFDDFDVS